MTNIPVVDLSKNYRGLPQAYKFTLIQQEGAVETPDTTEVTVDQKDADGNVMVAHGEDVPTDAETGYAKGCRFIDSNTTDGTNPEWINVGDEDSCEFVQLEDSLGVNDVGVPMRNNLRVASDVVSAQTVTIGADVYEVEIVNTDSTDDCANGDFNNTTNPLAVAGAVSRYANITFTEGKLIRIQNEILRVTDVDGGNVTFQRAASGTTAAAHADAQSIYVGDGIAGGSTVAVGLVTTLTPAAFTPALAADVNGVGTENVKAVVPSNNELLLQSSDVPGGTIVSSADAIACTETLVGTNNAWANATMVDGKEAGAREISVFTHTVTAVEVGLDVLRICLPFNPTGFIAQVYDAAGVFKGTLSDAIVITANRIQYDFTGATNVVATDKVTILAWN